MPRRSAAEAVKLTLRNTPRRSGRATGPWWAPPRWSPACRREALQLQAGRHEAAKFGLKKDEMGTVGSDATIPALLGGALLLPPPRWMRSPPAICPLLCRGRLPPLLSTPGALRMRVRQPARGPPRSVSRTSWRLRDRRGPRAFRGLGGGPARGAWNRSTTAPLLSGLRRARPRHSPPPRQPSALALDHHLVQAGLLGQPVQVPYRAVPLLPLIIFRHRVLSQNRS